MTIKPLFLVLNLLGVVFLETILENEVLQTRATIVFLTDKERPTKQRSAVPWGPRAMNCKQGIQHLFFAVRSVLK